MTTQAIEERLTLLEQELRLLKQHLAESAHAGQPWWQSIYGMFANTPAFEQAVLFGQQYRASCDDRVLEEKDETKHVSP